jgi:hypothetical protein
MKARAAAQQLLDTSLAALADDIKKQSPPKQLVENVRVLGDAPMQKTLHEGVAKLKASKVLSTSAEVLAVLKQAETTLPMLKKLVGRNALISMRRQGRVSMAMSWLVSEIVAFKPTKPADFVTHVDSLKDKLSAKGFGGKDFRLPRFALLHPLPPRRWAGATLGWAGTGETKTWVAAGATRGVVAVAVAPPLRFATVAA